MTKARVSRALLVAVGVWGSLLSASTARAANTYTITDLGPQHGPSTSGAGLNSIYGLSDSDQVIGLYWTGDQGYYPYIWQNGTTTNLNTLMPAGWSNNALNAVNGIGQIAGTGFFNGQTHLFVATPVPEPSTILSGLVGLGLVVLQRQRGRKVAC